MGRPEWLARPDPHTMSRLRASLAPAVVALLSGCLPAIAHGPQVVDGFSVGATASASTIRRSAADGVEDVLFAPIGANGGYGWRAEDPAHPSFRVGVHIPVMIFTLPQVDLFVQAPRSWTGPLQAGVGASTSAFSTASYVQLGRIAESGAGWHVTQAWMDAYDVDLRPRWMTMLAYQFESRGSVGSQVFVAGGPSTRLDLGDCEHDCVSDRRSMFLIAGFTFERRFSREPAGR